MEPPAPSSAQPRREHDADTTEWLCVLAPSNPGRDEGLRRLHELLLKAAGHEARRRAARLPAIRGPELDDIISQAAADALMSIVAKLDTFRGDSRFTTWAYKFAVFEVSAKLGRHFWLNSPAALNVENWEQLPERLAVQPGAVAELRAMLVALRKAVDEELTERQRRIFVAIVLNGALTDTVAAELGLTRNAVYKSLFDARRKLRSALVRQGFLDAVGGGE